MAAKERKGRKGFPVLSVSAVCAPFAANGIFICGWIKMSDVFTKRKRSAVMSKIRSRGNRDTEVALAKLLRAYRITGWRTQVVIRIEDRGSKIEGRKSPVTSHQSRVTIRPDFIFPKQRVAMFVDGCFWHGCPRHSNPAKWIEKSSMGGKRVQGSECFWIATKRHHNAQKGN